MARRTQKDDGLCRVNGRFVRTIGKFCNSVGKIAPKKFLLGTDERSARWSNTRLEQLWTDLTKRIGRDNLEAAEMHDKWLGELAGQGATPPHDCRLARQEQVLWDSEALGIAEAFRKGNTQIIVPLPEDLDDAGSRAYVEYVNRLRDRYPSVSFVPGDPVAFTEGQQAFKQKAERHAQISVRAAAIAEVSVPSEIGQSFYGAIDGFVVWVREHKKKGGQLTAWGRVLAEQALRLKDASPDVPLSSLDYNGLERIKNYWARRPNAKRSGEPIALDTVRTHLTAARMFVKWLHKNPDWKWRRPEDWEDALKLELASLMTDDEVSSLKNPVSTFSLEELAILYRYATDRERLVLLLGLNFGFARAECVSFRIDELDLDSENPTMSRVRRKSRVFGRFKVWPETVSAMRWLAAERARIGASDSKLVLISEKGQPLSETRIANSWNRLMRRVQHDRPGFKRLPFKFVRKTAAQLIRNVSDGETAATFLCHGQPVKGDDLSDVYSSRDFEKVFAALDRVHRRLAPVFAMTFVAFVNPRAKGSANITRGVIWKIEQLQAAGIEPLQIARELGVSRATAYRRIAQIKLMQMHDRTQQIPLDVDCH